MSMKKYPTMKTQMIRRGDSILATEDQYAVEKMAIRLMDFPELKQARKEAYAFWSQHAVGKTPDAKATLDNHVDNLIFVHTLGAANCDPARPRVVWYFAPKHEWMGLKTPSGRWGFTNPDNVYRTSRMDGRSKYEITVRKNNPSAPQFSIMLFDSSCGGDDTKQQSIWLDEPISALMINDNLKVEPDGSIKITIDSEPANGRPNHLQSNADAQVIMYRESFSDWEAQKPATIAIRRVAGPDTPEPTESEMAKKAVYFIEQGTKLLARLIYNGLYVLPYNVIGNPWVRGGGHGMSANGKFIFADDEALLVTIDPLGAQYFGFSIADPWSVEFEHIGASSTLSNHQSKLNNDGTYTFVISARDPGIHNWLDTTGYHEGTIMIRWQALPANFEGVDRAIRQVKRVKLGDLPNLLPPETDKITPEQREAMNIRRAESYGYRLSVK